MTAMTSEEVMRALLKIWGDFASTLDNVPIIKKLNNGRFRVEDYQRLLLNQRQQVIEGGRWIALAGANVDNDHFEIRSKLLTHSVTEHRDFKMLEDNYVSVGGAIEDIQSAEKNIGTEALNSFMFHQAGKPNPLNLLGAMFVIEGLGQNKAGEWGTMIKEQLELNDDQVSFLLYHSENDEDHMQEFDDILKSGILDIDGMGKSIIKTAKITARLYQLQLEEIDNV